MKNSKQVNEETIIKAFYSDNYASYAHVCFSKTDSIWRIRERMKNDYSIAKEVEYPGSKFKSIEAFIGYCKLKHSDIATGG